MELLIITGMSGAGKSTAARALEDIGFYCVDNILPSMIPVFADVCAKSEGKALSKVAITVDVRAGERFHNMTAILDQLREKNVDFKILFLDVSDEEAVRRYEETRRRHPLEYESTARSVAAERELLREMYTRADYIVDTTETSAAQLKRRINSLFLENANDGLNIQVYSFGFKYGEARGADLVFDVRCLPNPYYVNELRQLTGLDEPIRTYVLKWETTQQFMAKLWDLIDYSVPLYRDEGKSQLVIAFGCTGGKHRSVTFAELLYKHLSEAGYRVSVNHRDIQKV